MKETNTNTQLQTRVIVNLLLQLQVLCHLMGMSLFKLLWAQGKRCKVDDPLMHMHNSISFVLLQGKEDHSQALQCKRGNKSSWSAFYYQVWSSASQSVFPSPAALTSFKNILRLRHRLIRLETKEMRSSHLCFNKPSRYSDEPKVVKQSQDVSVFHFFQRKDIIFQGQIRNVLIYSVRHLCGHGEKL